MYLVAFPSELHILIGMKESTSNKYNTINTNKIGATIRIHVPTPTPGGPMNKIFFLLTSKAWN